MKRLKKKVLCKVPCEVKTNLCTDCDCDFFEYQIGIEDSDEICHLGLNLDNCETCINNKKLK